MARSSCSASLSLSVCVQFAQAAGTQSDMSECEQAKELGAINSTLR